MDNWENHKAHFEGYMTFYYRTQPVPQADPQRLCIIVAHLEDDVQQEHERLIIEVLKEFEGIQVLLLDRTITLKGPVPKEMEKRGQEAALGYLKQSGASALIWGTVLSLGDSTVPKVYWTASQAQYRKLGFYAASLVEMQFRLPEVLWADLADILRLLVALGEAVFRAQMGNYANDQLPPFIARVRRLLEASSNRPGWDAETRGAARVVLANALYVQGEQSGKNEPLQEAVVAYREVLKELTRERLPLAWAMTQNNLGIALTILGKRKDSIGNLVDAVAACREALKEYTQERLPLAWAMTQNNLGIALTSLGNWGLRDRGSLLEAVAAFQEALREYTRERLPLDWAETQNKLGIALTSLGHWDRSSLLEAVAAFQEALKEYTRERLPLSWAMTQSNRGDALMSLGEWEIASGWLEEAATAFEATLEIFFEQSYIHYIITRHKMERLKAIFQERGLPGSFD